MPVTKFLICLVMPPLAVSDKGVMPVVIVMMLTLLGWIPGMAAALILNSNIPKFNRQ